MIKKKWGNLIMKLWKSTIALVFVLLSILFVVGCSNNANDGENKEVIKTPELNDDEATLNLGGISSDSDDLDHLWEGRGDIHKVLMFRSLFLPDVDLQNVKPDLAEDYNISDDGLTYQIEMKEGLKWHDGEDLTAEDVIWSIETVLKATQINAIYSGAFSTIEGADEWKGEEADGLSGISVDDNVITIKLSEKVGNFIPVLGQFPIYPKHLLEDE